MSWNGSRATWLTAGATVGGLLCLGCMILLVASTIVLGLIPLYLSNHGEVGYGEHYRIGAFFIVVLYRNTSLESLNGTVVDSVGLSTLCGTAYRNQGVREFAGCLAKSFTAFDAQNTSLNDKRRRRRAPIAGLYEIGEVNLYYSTACSHHGDTNGTHANSTGLSSCLKRRLATCNSFSDGSSQKFSWTQSSGPFVQTIISESRNVSQAIIVDQVYGLSILTTTGLAKNLNQSDTIIGEIRLGCEYMGLLSQEAIAGFLSSQQTTTMAPEVSSTPSGG